MSSNDACFNSTRGLWAYAHKLYPSSDVIDYLPFTFRSRIFPLYGDQYHQCWWRATKFRHMLCAHGPWAGKNLYHATPAATRDFSFPASSEGVSHLVASNTIQGGIEDLFLPLGSITQKIWGLLSTHSKSPLAGVIIIRSKNIKCFKPHLPKTQWAILMDIWKYFIW
jgi:hypothetical protein